MRQNQQTYQDLILELPVKLQQLTELKITQNFSRHAVAYITGLLEEENKTAVYELTNQTNITIKIKTDETEKIIFTGIPMHVTIKHIRAVAHIAIILKSSSVLMDIRRKSRSFQNPNNTLTNLCRTIIQEYNGDIIDTAAPETKQNCALIQYQETDWTFLRRIASRKGALIHPNHLSAKPQIYIGLPVGDNYTENTTNYSLAKDLTAYLRRQENYEHQPESQALTYQMESSQDYQLGDQITYQQIPLVVAQKITELKKGLLTHSYRLNPAGWLTQTIIHNLELKGASIEGAVIAVAKDKLKLHLTIDPSQDPAEAAWYPFATPYTAQGSTGWYSMPQPGDSVQLYLPTADEAAAYVSTVNRQDGLTNPKAQIPADKYYGAIQGQEMKLTPQELTFSATENQLYLKMDNQTGVTISSNQDINLKAGPRMTGEGQTVDLTAKERITLAVGSSGIIVDDILHIKS
ncbi:MAG: contractile injection system protein, VgrG/Pvc8 family [Firmicutes bacterium]|nr:contractile injection system protein, VgrG/Pvc8 family [Bacillota bacterium]